jgi:uncharacterized protein with PIN domain
MNDLRYSSDNNCFNLGIDVKIDRNCYSWAHFLASTVSEAFKPSNRIYYFCSGQAMGFKFVADNNVGKLARWLRLIGYDTLLFRQKNDSQMIRTALSEGRVILTKDSQFMRRRLVTSGRIKAIHIKQDNPELQVQELVQALNLNYHFKPFSLCLECNQELIARDIEDMEKRVPTHVFRTQTQYTECPACHRVYWRGTHWQAMVKKLQELQSTAGENYAFT